MADLSQMLRWNANFVRGLAQSVLERAKEIRVSLSPSADSPRAVALQKKSAAKVSTAKKALKKVAKSKAASKRTRKSNG